MAKAKISGEVLSRLLSILSDANLEQLDSKSLLEKITSVVDSSEDIYVAVDSVKPSKNFNYDNLNLSRSTLLSESSMEKLNVMLPWSSISEVGIDKYLGTAWSTRKRAAIATFPDPLVSKLNNKLPLKDFRILEVGCFEGHHTASLAALSKSVVAFDGRLENVIKTLVHCWLMGIEQQVHVECIDIETLNVKDTLATLGVNWQFDLVHHRGVLYHLSDPCKHLSDLAKVTSKHIYLHTQIANTEQAKDKYQTEFGEIDAFFYKEPKVGFSPFSGLTPKAVWLTKESLSYILISLGFKNINILSEKIERNGVRIELIASRG